MNASIAEALKTQESQELRGNSTTAQIVDLLAGSPELDFVAVEQILSGLKPAGRYGRRLSPPSPAGLVEGDERA